MGRQASKGPRTGRAVRRPKRWTILVWMAADNDLDPDAMKDLEEMKRVGSSVDVDVVVQIDRAGRTGLRRYHVQKGSLRLVERLPERNSGNPRTATAFFTWGMQKFPSDRVMAVVWNHGTGVADAEGYTPGRKGSGHGHARRVVPEKRRRGLFVPTVARRTKAIALDDSSRDALDNVELGRVFRTVIRRAGRPLDVIGLDACLMNMVEVTYQLRECAEHLVASEETEPVEGWPWRKLLRSVVARPGMTGLEVARKVVSYYVGSYKRSAGVTCSAVDLARAEPLARAVDALAAACIRTLDNDRHHVAFGNAIRSAQRFDTRDFVDLGDLCLELHHHSRDPRVKAAAKRVLQCLRGRRPFVVAERHKGRDVAGSTGTSIYLPVVGDAAVSYRRLGLARDTRWSELLRASRPKRRKVVRGELKQLAGANRRGR